MELRVLEKREIGRKGFTLDGRVLHEKDILKGFYTMQKFCPQTLRMLSPARASCDFSIKEKVPRPVILDYAEESTRHRTGFNPIYCCLKRGQDVLENPVDGLIWKNEDAINVACYTNGEPVILLQDELGTCVMLALSQNALAYHGYEMFATIFKKLGKTVSMKIVSNGKIYINWELEFGGGNVHGYLIHLMHRLQKQDDAPSNIRFTFINIYEKDKYFAYKNILGYMNPVLAK